MKKLLLLALMVSLIFVNVHALGKLQVKSITELAPTHTSMVVRDADGKYAPALIVKTELKGLGFKNIGRPTPHAAIYEEGDHQYKFYMNDKQRVIKITHSDYEPLEVRLLTDWNIEVKAQRVYEMVLENQPENEVIPFNIITNPNDATKFIDDKSLGTGESFELEIGDHVLRVEKEGYEPHSETITVSKTKPYINITLAEAEPVKITIKSTPLEADVYINNMNEGKTNKQLFYFPGSYQLRLVKDKYDPIEETITVTETGENEFIYNLQKNVFQVTIKTEPQDCEISINLDKITGNTKELPIGEYNIRIRKNKYEPIEGKITVTKNGKNEFIYNLQKNTSNLNINTTPASCEITVNKSKMTGTSKEVSAGTYQIVVKKEGYESDTRTVVVEKGINKTESFTLVQKTGKLQFVAEPMDATTTMKSGSSVYNSWSGSKYLTDVPIGTYELRTDLNGYQKQTKTISIKQNETTQTGITLAKATQETPRQTAQSNSTSSNDSMVFVKGGSFRMGSNSGDSDEKPIHTVTVSDFYIGKYEVTQEDWQAVMGNNPSYLKGDNNPVEKVSWFDAVEYCNKLSQKEGLTKCYSGSGDNIQCNFNANGYRLPTEAEWEYAARGGSLSKGYTYSGSNNIGDVAWYDSNSGNKTHPIGQKTQNELGIYDMTGNVWEWCWDWKGSYSSGSQTNPKGASRSSNRVLRGGSWRYNASFCRVAYRINYYPDYRHDYIGFRVVRSSR